MVTLDEVKQVIPSSIKVEKYIESFGWGIKVYYTKNAPQFKIKKIGNYYFQWHYNEYPQNGIKIRLYLQVNPKEVGMGI